MILLTFTTKPMEHQQKAIDKLSKTKVGALYMDMGTGKTRTALDIAVKKIKDGRADCILWLCPVSVKQAITEEIQKHIPSASYEILQPAHINNQDANIYIAGIESLSSSVRLNKTLLRLTETKRCFTVCDESSLIKNHQANRTLAVWRIGERSSYRFILSGTPLSNNEQDLYSQWYFLDKRILGYNSYYSFAANHLEFDPSIHGRIIRAHDTKHLVSKISPFVYQVRKEDCLDLPPKTYSTRYCDMEDKQEVLYNTTKERMLDSLEYKLKNYAIFDSHAILSLLTALQKVSSGLNRKGQPLFVNPSDNPKIKLLLETIDELPNDAKAIIWCKYTKEIEWVYEVLTKRGHKVSLLHGGINLKQRNHEIDKFKQDARFLVANKRCGAFGLNLQHCHYAIYLSNDFSWETRAQSEERIYRAGQVNNVHIIDLIMCSSVESMIMRALWSKENLVDHFRKEIDSKKNIRRVLDDQDWVHVVRENGTSAKLYKEKLNA